MLKKIIILFALIIIVVGVGALFYFKLNSRPGVTAPNPGNASNGGITSQASALPVVHLFPDMPQSDSFAIGTPEGSITVKNFYNLPMTIDQNFLILEDTNDYQITYDTNDGQFFIYASSTPLATARADGEAAFLAMLGISQADACKLNVAEGYPPGSPPANQQPGLSFCSSGAFSQ